MLHFKKENYFFCPYIYFISRAFNLCLYQIFYIIHKTKKYSSVLYFKTFKPLKAEKFFYNWFASLKKGSKNLHLLNSSFTRFDNPSTAIF